MPDNAHRPFRGVFDVFSELNRMREHWTEIEPTQGRSQPAPWVPSVDIFASGQDLVIRCELAGVAKGRSTSRSPTAGCGSPASAPALPRTGPTSTSASAATAGSSAASSSSAGSPATR
jgi:hypothetical protein